MQYVRIFHRKEKLFQKKRNFYSNSGVYINEDAKNEKNPLFYPSFFHGISNG